MSVIVTRLPSDKPGPDISTFLKTPAAQVEIGRGEINANTSADIETLSRIFAVDFISPGEIIQIQDEEGIRKSKVTEFYIKIYNNGSSVESTLTSETPKP